MSEKKVHLIVTNGTFISGELVPQGTVLREQDAESAYNLVGSGKAEVATEERVQAAEKAAAKAAEKK